LKIAKQAYLQLKGNSYSLHDAYLSQSEEKERKAIWRKEENKLY